MSRKNTGDGKKKEEKKRRGGRGKKNTAGLLVRGKKRMQGTKAQSGRAGASHYGNYRVLTAGLADISRRRKILHGLYTSGRTY